MYIYTVQITFCIPFRFPDSRDDILITHDTLRKYCIYDNDVRQLSTLLPRWSLRNFLVLRIRVYRTYRYSKLAKACKIKHLIDIPRLCERNTTIGIYIRYERLFSPVVP